MNTSLHFTPCCPHTLNIPSSSHKLDFNYNLLCSTCFKCNFKTINQFIKQWNFYSILTILSLTQAFSFYPFFLNNNMTRIFPRSVVLPQKPWQKPQTTRNSWKKLPQENCIWNLKIILLSNCICIKLPIWVIISVTMWYFSFVEMFEDKPNFALCKTDGIWLLCENLE